MNEMRKLMETVTNPPKKQLTEAPTKLWFYGDEEFEPVSGPIPAKFLAAWIDALENDYGSLERLTKT